MHLTRTRVRYGETDQMGVVYHANYLAYFEIGRTEFLRETGLSYADVEKTGWRFPVIETSLKLLAPARYDEELLIATRLTKVTGVKIQFEYTVSRERENQVLAQGHTVLASVDENGRPRRLPPEFRQALLAAEET